MTTAITPTRHRRLKIALAIVGAILIAPVLLVIFLANMTGERR